MSAGDFKLENGRCRIVVTGGPGGGKTTAADLFRREIGERVVIVPEAATLLFSGGFPRVAEPHARVAAQTAIYHVQRNLEEVQSARYPDRVLLCDRGTVDGAAYWPGEPEEFFAAVGSSAEREFSRYDAVLFFETAAAGGMSVEGGNPMRIESNAEAVDLDYIFR
jgi:predicted ATPase